MSDNAGKPPASKASGKKPTPNGQVSNPSKPHRSDSFSIIPERIDLAHIVDVKEVRTKPQKSIGARQETNSTLVTLFYIIGLLLLLGGSIYCSQAIVGALQKFILTFSHPTGTASPEELALLGEQLKGTNSLISSITSGLLTALGIVIGNFFSRSARNRDMVKKERKDDEE